MRVLVSAIDQHLKMKIRTGRAASAAHLANFLPAFNQIAFFNKCSGRMGIARDKVVTVIDLQHITVS